MTTASLPSDMTAETAAVLWAVDMPVCRLCLDGAGGTCQVPGCAFWMTDAPSRRFAAVLREHTALADGQPSVPRRWLPSDMTQEAWTDLTDNIDPGNERPAGGTGRDER